MVLALSVVGACLLGPGPATAATDEQVATGASRAVSWLRDRQDPVSGVLGCVSTIEQPCAATRPNPFGGDWSLLGLAASGVHAADLRAAGGPSAQSWFRRLWGDADESSWTGLGQQQASDFSRTILAARAAGLPPTRISPTRNLVAGLAGYAQNGTGYFAAPGLRNQHVFALLALQGTTVAASPAGRALLDRSERLIASFQDPGTGALDSIVDLQGAALAALCGAGRTSEDAVVAKGIANLLSRRAANGAFGNSSSTGWALAGLAACGVTRGSAPWRADGLESSIDALLRQQIGADNDDPTQRGGFPVAARDPLPASARGDYYATQDGLRALVDPTFAVDAPARPGGAPSQAPAPAVPDGTDVPVALVVDVAHDGVALRDEELRFCSGTAPAGASLRVVLERLRSASKPTGCVVDPRWDGDRLVALNGRRTVSGGSGWRVSLDGAAEVPAREQRVGFGDVVALRLGDPAPDLVPPTPETPPATDPGAPAGGTAPAPPSAPGTVPPTVAPGGPPAAAAVPPAAGRPRPAAASRTRALVSCRLRDRRRARCTVRVGARTTVAVRVPGSRRSVRRTGTKRITITVVRRARLRPKDRLTVRLTVAGRSRTVVVRPNGRTTTVRV